MSWYHDLARSVAADAASWGIPDDDVLVVHIRDDQYAEARHEPRASLRGAWLDRMPSADAGRLVAVFGRDGHYLGSVLVVEVDPAHGYTTAGGVA